MTPSLLVALVGLLLLVSSWTVTLLFKKDCKYIVATTLAAMAFGLFVANIIYLNIK